MRLEQLQYIIEIADTGSFTTASERLFIAQPSISQAVNSLEKELNLTLFKRSRLGAEPTEIGQKIIALARNALSQINEIEKIGNSNYAEIYDTITVSAVPTLCATLLPKSIALYKKLFPNVTLKIREEGSKKIRWDVKNGSADFGLVTRHSYISYDETEHFHHLFSGKIMAYVGKKSPLAHKKITNYEELVQYPIILFGDAFSLSDYIMNRLKEYGTPQILTSSQNPESIKNFVMETDVIGFGPDVSLVNNLYVHSGDIIPLHIDDAEITQFGILTNPNRLTSVASEALIKEIILQADHFERFYLNRP